jgi:hypothetical protein
MRVLLSRLFVFSALCARKAHDQYAFLHTTVRFMAGAPYEDLAFKIVRKEWEMNRKYGYRCRFDKGTLTLCFNFKRYFYRR